MIRYRSGEDILASDAEALVNTVNCVGVMGRGIALQFKKAYPDNFRAYASACKLSEVRPGRMFVFDTGRLTNPRYIINFPTKRHWRGKSRMEDIESGLNALVTELRNRDITSVAIPPLGAGLGGLPWSEVQARIEATLANLPGVEVTVFEPTGGPTADRMVKSGKAPRMTAGRAALVLLMRRYLDGMLDTSVSLLEVHKLMYFLQLAGEPLRLDYRQDRYGPYAADLRHVLNHVEGHLVSGYADGGDDPTKPLNLIDGASAKAADFLAESDDTRERIDRVARLIEGFESPDGLELLATVHWVAESCPNPTPQAVVEGVYAWNERKRKFTARQIRIAIAALTGQGWLPTIV